MLRLRVDGHAVDAAWDDLLCTAELNVRGPGAQGGIVPRLRHLRPHGRKERRKVSLCRQRRRIEIPIIGLSNESK